MVVKLQASHLCSRQQDGGREEGGLIGKILELAMRHCPLCSMSWNWSQVPLGEVGSVLLPGLLNTHGREEGVEALWVFWSNSRTPPD